MFIKIVKHLIIMLLLTGCLSSNRNSLPIIRHVSIDHSFSDLEKNDILNSLDEWKISTNNSFNYKIVNYQYNDEFYKNCKDNSLFILKKSYNSEDIILREKHYNTLLGLAIFKNEPCNFEKIFIVHDRINNRNLFKFVVLHELGHILNLNHNNKKSIMNTKYSDGLVNLTEYDIDLFFKINKFN